MLWIILMGVLGLAIIAAIALAIMSKKQQHRYDTYLAERDTARKQARDAQEAQAREARDQQRPYGSGYQSRSYDDVDIKAVEQPRYPASRYTIIAVGLTVAALAITAFCMIKNVPRLTYANVTQFNVSTSRDLGAGIHVIAPWQGVYQLSGVTELDSYVAEKHLKEGEEADGKPYTVQLVGDSQATMSARVKYRVNPAGVSTLYQERADNDYVKNLVHLELEATLLAAFAEYNPIAVDKDGDVATATPASFNGKVARDLQGLLENRVEVLSVSILAPDFDPDTQKALNNLQTEVANTGAAQQRGLTAEHEADAFETLIKSLGSADLAVRYMCIQQIDQARASNYQMPAGYSCMGGDSAIVVPSAPTTAPVKK